MERYEKATNSMTAKSLDSMECVEGNRMHVAKLWTLLLR